MPDKLTVNSPFEAHSDRDTVIKKHPFLLILMGSVLFGLINLFNPSSFRILPEIEWHDMVSQSFIILIMLWWTRITVRSRITSRTFNLFFLGCANLIWLMVIKFFGEIYVKQTALLTTFELLLAVSGLVFITLGLVSWSREFQFVIGQLKDSSSRYREMSETDPLTGLLNRGQFDAIMSHVVGEGRALSLVLIDLDHFKKVNDRYGHPVGDTVIKRTAELLGGHLRGSDYAFRIGGEEFALLYVQCPQELVVQRAQTIRQKMADEQYLAEGQADFSITASLGVVHYTNTDDTSSIYQRADAALYQAKENGRNQVVVI